MVLLHKRPRSGLISNISNGKKPKKIFFLVLFLELKYFFSGIVAYYYGYTCLIYLMLVLDNKAHEKIIIKELLAIFQLFIGIFVLFAYTGNTDTFLTNTHTEEFFVRPRVMHLKCNIKVLFCIFSIHMWCFACCFFIWNNNDNTAFVMLVFECEYNTLKKPIEKWSYKHIMIVMKSETAYNKNYVW